MRLICLPFAGGSSLFFSEWKGCLGKEIELVPMEYAGHGKRFCEELTDTFQSTLDDIITKIEKLTDTDYALFGHSMGAVYVYEAVKIIEARGLRRPSLVIVSGSEAPYEQDKKQLYKLNRMDFLEELYKFGGIPQEAYENEELMELLYPILFNDVRNLELYRLDHRASVPQKIQSPVLVLYGDEDEDFGEKEAVKWQAYCTQENVVQGFCGGHFFIESRKEEVCELLRNKLLF